MRRIPFRLRLLAVVLVAIVVAAYTADRRHQNPANEPKVAWTREIGAKSANVQAVISGTGGRIYVAGAMMSPGGKAEEDVRPYIALFSPTGQKLWSRPYLAGDFYEFSSAANDSTRNVYFTGRSYYGHIPVVKISPDGKILKIAKLGDQCGQGTFATGVVLDTAGSVYVVGSDTQEGLSSEMFKLDADLRLTCRRYVPVGHASDDDWSTVSTVTVDDSSNAWVAADAAMAVITPKSKILWSRNHRDRIFGSDTVNVASIQARRNAIYVVGSVSPGSSSCRNLGKLAELRTRVFGNERPRGFIAKLNLQGKLVWITKFSSSECCRFSALAIDQRGDLYACGDVYVDRQGSSYSEFLAHLVVAKCNEAGELLWQKHLDRLASGSKTAIAVTANQDIYVVGNREWIADQDRTTRLFITKLTQ